MAFNARNVVKVTARTVNQSANLQRAIDAKVDGAFRYIAGAIRRNARNSMKLGSATNPHSQPGKAAHSPKPRRTLRNTIERDYDRYRKTLVVGPIRKFKRSSTRPTGSRTVPQTVEFGGKVVQTKGKLIPIRKVPPQHRYRLRNQGRRRRSRANYVYLKPGKYQVDQRPTMQLALKKTVTAPNLQAAFNRIGFSDPTTLIRN